MTPDELRAKAREWRRRREDIHGRHGGNVAELTFSEIDELLADFAESLEPAAPTELPTEAQVAAWIMIHKGWSNEMVGKFLEHSGCGESAATSPVKEEGTTLCCDRPTRLNSIPWACGNCGKPWSGIQPREGSDSSATPGLLQGASATPASGDSVSDPLAADSWPSKCECGHMWHGDFQCNWRSDEEGVDLHCECQGAYVVLDSEGWALVVGRHLQGEVSKTPLAAKIAERLQREAYAEFGIPTDYKRVRVILEEELNR